MGYKVPKPINLGTKRPKSPRIKKQNQDELNYEPHYYNYEEQNQKQLRHL